MRSDVLQKALSENGEAILYALDATELVQESMERLDAWPPATKHLGQSMMAALLLQALADSDEGESLSLQWMCEGPFGHLYAEARNFGEVRGTIRDARPGNVADYDTSLGSGILQVRRSKGTRGTTSIVNSGGVVSSDVVEYLEQSEQKNCGVSFSVVVDWEDEARTRFRVTSAVAYLVHIMPQPSEQKLNEALLRWDRQMQLLGPISRWQLRDDQITADMLRLLSGEPEPKIVMTQRVTFRCNCSVDRALRALALLEAQEEKEGGKKEEGPTQIRCEYCGKNYTIETPAAKAPRKKKREPAQKMRTKRTNGVRIDVETYYVSEKSVPALNQYLFGYEITITNENPEAVQLLHRHWLITDALGRVDEVKGPGVIGKQPRLKSGESFTYDSFCPLPTPFGSMRGTYKMMRDNGEFFDVEVPLFSLVQSKETEQSQGAQP